MSKSVEDFDITDGFSAHDLFSEGKGVGITFDDVIALVSLCSIHTSSTSL